MDSGTVVMYVVMTFLGGGFLYALIMAPVAQARINRDAAEFRAFAARAGWVRSASAAPPPAYRPDAHATRPRRPRKHREPVLRRDLRGHRVWMVALASVQTVALGDAAMTLTSFTTRYAVALRGGPHPDRAERGADPRWWLTSGVLVVLYQGPPSAATLDARAEDIVARAEALA